jgi:TBC1 domain family member 2
MTAGRFLFQIIRMLKGRSFPGKVLLTRRSEPLSPPDYSPSFESEHDEDERKEGSRQEVICY